jgi:hypothetical protein
MNAIRARLVMFLARLLLARLAAWGVVEVTPETGVALQRWLELVLELFLFGLDAWLEPRLGFGPRARRDCEIGPAPSERPRTKPPRHP